MKLKKTAALLLSLTIFSSAMPAMAKTENNQNEPQLFEEKTDISSEDFQQKIQEQKEKRNAAKALAEEDVDEVTLMAADEVKISGTISLPSGVTAADDGYISIFLSELEKDSNNKITNVSYSRFDSSANIKKGKSSVSYSVSAPKGSYALGVEYYDGQGILNTEEYYTAKGNVRTLELADTFTSNKTVNMTLSKPERTIGGTITLNEAAEKSGDIYISLNSTSDSYYSLSVPVAKGQKTVPYSIGVTKGSYSLYADSNADEGGTYSVYGDLRDYGDICYLDVTEESLNNIDFKCDYMPYEPVSIETVPVTLTLPNTVSENKSYRVHFEAEYRTYSSTVTINAGNKSGSQKIRIPSYDFILSVQDRTNNGSYYYYSENLGWTTKEEEATLLSPDDVKNGINLDFLNCYTLTGTVSRNGNKTGEALDVYAVADIGDEKFYTSVEIAPTSNSAQYSIFIPKSLDGEECNVYTTMLQYSRWDFIGEKVTVSVGANMKANISAPADCYKAISGTITLSDAAPACGAVVEISGRYDTARYYIPAGSKTVSYSTYFSTDTDYIGVELLSDDERFNVFGGQDLETEDRFDYTLIVKNKTITGTVKIPDGVDLTNAVSYEIYAEYNCGDSDYSTDIYSSIMKGKKQKDYTINVPENATLINLVIRVSASGALPFASEDIYYTPDGNTTEYPNIEIPLTNGLSGADFELKMGKAISGKIIVPDGVKVDDVYECKIYLRGEEYYNSKYFNINSKNTDFMFVLPEEVTGDFVLSYYVYTDSDNIYSDSVYYSENGPVLEESEATVLTIDDKTISGINLEIATVKANINITAKAPSYALNDSLKSLVTIVFDNGKILENVLYTSDDDTISVLSTADYKDAASFKVYYSVNDYGDEYSYTYENMYINADGSVTQDEDKATSYPLKHTNIAFTVWDNSVLLDNAIKNGTVELEVADFAPDESGDMNISITYSNSDDIDYNAECFYVIYDLNGALVDMASAPISLSSSETNGEINLTYGTVDTENYQYKLFIWNNKSQMIPVKEAKTLTV